MQLTPRAVLFQKIRRQQSSFSDISRPTAVVALCVIGLGSLGAAFVWIVLSDLPLAFDEVTFFLQTKGFYDALTGSRPLVDAFFRAWNPHGATFQLLTAIGMLFASPTPRWAAIGNLFCVPILAISIYRIGRHVHSRLAGIMATLFAVTSPMMAWMSHTPLEDYALVSFVALAVYFLLRSNLFQETRYSLAFGLSAGIAVVTKLPAISFFYLPVLGAMTAGIWHALRRPRAADRASCRRVTANILAAGAVALGVSSVWYIPHLQATVGLFFNNQQWGVTLGHPSGGLAAVNTIVDGVLYDQLGILHGFLGLCGALWSMSRMRRNALLWLEVVGCAVFWIYWPQKDPRYTLPWVTAIAPWTGAAIASIPWRSWRRAVIAMTTGAMIFLFTGINFSLPGLPDEKRIYIAGFNCTLYVQRRGWLVGPPHREEWPYPEMVEVMRRHFVPAKPDPRPYVLMTVADGYFGPDPLELYAELAGFPVYGGALFEIKPDLSNFEQVVNKTDFLIYCASCTVPFSKAIDDKVRDEVVRNPVRVELLRTFRLPNGAVASLYRLKAWP